jgi:hypothetical protein
MKCGKETVRQREVAGKNLTEECANEKSTWRTSKMTTFQRNLAKRQPAREMW